MYIFSSIDQDSSLSLGQDVLIIVVDISWHFGLSPFSLLLFPFLNPSNISESNSPPSHLGRYVSTFPTSPLSAFPPLTSHHSPGMRPHVFVLSELVFSKHFHSALLKVRFKNGFREIRASHRTSFINKSLDPQPSEYQVLNFQISFLRIHQFIRNHL